MRAELARQIPQAVLDMHAHCDLLGFFTPNIPGRRRVVEGTDTAV